MTPRTPKPKPVEAWAVYNDCGQPVMMSTRNRLWIYAHRLEAVVVAGPESVSDVHRVRIVPITPKKRTRTKRKEKKK